jgi:uroporphyrinogen decarboxylase
MIRNMKSWQEEIIKSGSVAALPIMTYPGLQLTHESVMQATTNAFSQARCMESLARRYSTVASVSMMDLSVEAEVFGSRVVMSETEAPSIRGSIVTDRMSAESLPVPNVGDGRTGIYLEAVEIAAQRIVDRPVFGGMIGPLSLAVRLMEMKRLLLGLRRDPSTVHTVLTKTTAFLAGYAKAIKATGANGMIIAEPAAGLLSPAECDSFSSDYVRTIVEAVQDSSFSVILHNCGNTVKLVDSMVSTGAAGFHFGNGVSMAEVLRQVPPDRLAIGNIDPAGIFKLGTPEKVRERVSNLLSDVGYTPNFVLSSGCDIPPSAPLENVDAFFDALEEFNGSSETQVS